MNHPTKDIIDNHNRILHNPKVDKALKLAREIHKQEGCTRVAAVAHAFDLIFN